MSGIITELQYYFSYPFVRYALVVGVLVALCSSLFGVSLVLKRFSFIGDGLSHVAFGAMAFATMFKLANTTVLVMPLTVLAAIFLLRTGQNTRIKGDSAIAMLSVGALAVGYLIMNVFSVSANVSGDVCSTLFGSTTILTLTGAEVTICIVMSVIVVAFFVLFYNRIFAVTFDETFLRATGKKAELYNLMIAVITDLSGIICHACDVQLPQCRDLCGSSLSVGCLRGDDSLDPVLHASRRHDCCDGYPDLSDQLPGRKNPASLMRKNTKKFMKIL